MGITLNEEVQTTAAWITKLRAEVGKVIVGQEQLVDRLLVGLLANGHVLLEGVPGLAKTLSMRTLATAIHASPPDIAGAIGLNWSRLSSTEQLKSALDCG